MNMYTPPHVHATAARERDLDVGSACRGPRAGSAPGPTQTER